MIHIIISMILFTAVALLTGGAYAQGYPNKAIRVIVPAAPGDSCDVLSRLIGQKVGERLGQQFAVDNRVGPAARSASCSSPRPRQTATPSAADRAATW